jgi:hypothetical protein
VPHFQPNHVNARPYVCSKSTARMAVPHFQPNHVNARPYVWPAPLTVPCNYTERLKSLRAVYQGTAEAMP